MSARPPCARCGAALPPLAKFCGGCGAATRAHRDTVRARMGAAHALERRHALAVGMVFVGTLLGLLGVTLALGEGADEAVVAAWSFATEVCAGLAAVAILGRGSLAGSFAGRPTLRDVLLAVPVGALAFAVAAVWVDVVLGGAFEGDAGDDLVAPGLSASMAFAVIVGAPLVEEWLDRGVLWRALTPLTTPRGQVVVTAALFAIAHGLGGGFVLEFPHRFVGGLALGVLRARSGSLVPPVVAHMTWNALAVSSGG